MIWLYVYLVGAVAFMVLTAYMANEDEDALELGCMILGMGVLWPAGAIFLLGYTLARLIGLAGQKVAKLRRK